jgi:hypothetical protein
MLKELSIIQKDPVAEFYGDEARRFEELQLLSYPDFKQQLLTIHNSILDDKPEDHFVTGLNGTTRNKIFPRPEDKDMLLEYALRQAQEQPDVQDAALILGAAIVFIHPFNDGNGRTSRTLYGQLSRGFTYEAGKKTEANAVQLNGIGRDFIDFEGITLLEPFIEDIVFKEADVPAIASSAWYISTDKEAAKHHYGPREYHGLSDAEARELDVLLGEKHGVDGVDPDRYLGNGKSILYGFSCLVKEYGIELPKRTFEGGRELVITPDALAQLDGDQKRKFIEYTKAYNTLYAKAAIDILGKYKNEPIRLDGGEVSTIKSYIVEHTNNYIASKKNGTAMSKFLDMIEKRRKEQ